MPLPLSISGVEVLVNGIAAPLYYVAPGQLNVQIPYETTASGSAVASINNNGQVTTQSFQMAAAAPGIFTDSTGALVPTSAAALGQESCVLYHGRGGRLTGHPRWRGARNVHRARRTSDAVAENHRDNWRSRSDHRFYRHSFGAWSA